MFFRFGFWHIDNNRGCFYNNEIFSVLNLLDSELMQVTDFTYELNV